MGMMSRLTRPDHAPWRRAVLAEGRARDGRGRLRADAAARLRARLRALFKAYWQSAKKTVPVGCAAEQATWAPFGRTAPRQPSREAAQTALAEASAAPFEIPHSIGPEDEPVPGVVTTDAPATRRADTSTPPVIKASPTTSSCLMGCR